MSTAARTAAAVPSLTIAATPGVPVDVGQQLHDLRIGNPTRYNELLASMFLQTGLVNIIEHLWTTAQFNP